MSARAIKNVAVIGGSGNIGGQITDALLNASFNVTVITRLASAAQFPPSVKVHRLDLSSKSALVAALQGQDAIVSLVSRKAIDSQPLIIDAAIEAGVSRFIPSEFGVDTRALDGDKVGTQLQTKIQTRKYLEEKAAQNQNFSWTGLGAGILFDWGIKVLVGADAENRTMTIVDSGNETFQATNLTLIAAAVAAILRRPAETANKYLLIASFHTTQNEVLWALEAQTGGRKWTVRHTSAAELEAAGDKKRAAGDATCFLDYLKLYAYADGAGHTLDEQQSANALLGLEKQDLETTLKALVK